MCDSPSCEKVSPDEARFALWRNTGTLCVTATTMNLRQTFISCKQKEPVTDLFHRSKAKLDVKCKKKKREGQRWFSVERLLLQVKRPEFNPQNSHRGEESMNATTLSSDLQTCVTRTHTQDTHTRVHAHSLK